MSNTLIEKKFTQAAKLIADLMIENGLSDWTIKTNAKRSALAETYYTRKEIQFSKFFLMVADKDHVTGVALHEIAHALVGVGHGHGKVFQDKCKEISPNADYAQRSVSIVSLRRFLLTCPSCGQSGSHNSSLVRYCGKCFAKDQSKVKFEVKPNVLEVKVW